MNKQDRELLELLREALSFEGVKNPCDIKGLARFYRIVEPNINMVRNYLDEITCYDIPQERLLEIIEELKNERT